MSARGEVVEGNRWRYPANPFHPNTYEATLVYLIRQQGELTIHTDRQVLGLFSQATWEKLCSTMLISPCRKQA